MTGAAGRRTRGQRSEGLLKANMRAAKGSPSQQVGYAAAFLRAQLVRLPKDRAQELANEAVRALVGLAAQAAKEGAATDDRHSG